jgi:hypothetical protein
MFGQFLPNKNKMLQCSTVLHSESAAADSGHLNTPRFFYLLLFTCGRNQAEKCCTDVPFASLKIMKEKYCFDLKDKPKKTAYKPVEQGH